MDRESIDEAGKIVEKLFPDDEARKAYLKMFAEAVGEADKHGKEKWGVTLHTDRIRLNVGSLVACTLHEGYIWFALPKEAGEDFTPPSKLSGWTSTPICYKPIPSISGEYEYDRDYHDKVWPKIRRQHFKFIKLASEKYKRLSKKSRETHSPGVLLYLKENMISGPSPKPSPENDITGKLNSLIMDIGKLKNVRGHTERDHESLVESFYNKLGYEKASEIKYRTGRIDVGIIVDGNIYIVNEVKKDWNLSYRTHGVLSQAYDYANTEGATYVVITNGDYYAIFDRTQGKSYDDNLIGELRLSEQLTDEKLKLIKILMKK